MKTKLLILFLVLLVPNGKSFAIDINDSCYTLIWRTFYPGYVLVNPDSVLLDTCSCKGWNRAGCWYARKSFTFIAPYGLFNLPEYPRDTTIVVSIFDMDSNFTEIKKRFQDLETMYGNFIMTKKNPKFTDSSITARSFNLEFENYCNIDSVENFIMQNNVSYDFWYENRVAEVLVDVINYSNDCIKKISLYPNPTSNFIEINFERCPTSPRCRTSNKIEIYNVLSECVKTVTIHPMTESHRMNIEDLPQGVYFITIIQQNQIFYHKSFVKEN